MKFNLKADVLLIGTALVLAGAALDRGINFVNWKLFAMAMSGEQLPVCPVIKKEEASSSPPLPMPLSLKAMEPFPPLQSLGNKPEKKEPQAKEKDEPAVTVDLTKGRKGSEVAANQAAEK